MSFELVYFECLQETNEIFVRISALASKKRSNKKGHFLPLFWFDLFLEAMARTEILSKISLVFRSIWSHQKDISKLADFY